MGETENNEKGTCETREIPEISIDEQFKALLPALDGQTYAALIWIITTQVARRNLTPMQLSYFRGLHYRADRRIVKNEAGKNQYEQMYEVLPQNGAKPQSEHTARRLANEYNVSRNTINRDAQLSEAIDAIGEKSSEAKREILSGSAQITRQRLQELAAGGTEDEIRAVAESIEAGTYERPKRAASDPFADDVMGAPNAALSKMADEFDTVIQRVAKEVEAAQLKTALRGHIAKLEDLYNRL